LVAPVGALANRPKALPTEPAGATLEPAPIFSPTLLVITSLALDFTAPLMLTVDAVVVVTVDADAASVGWEIVLAAYAAAVPPLPVLLSVNVAAPT
jgi:hypothetical protein